MTLAAFLAVARGRRSHAAAFFDDDAMDSFLIEHTARLDDPPPCRTALDALAIVEELERIDTDDDIAADPAVLLAALKGYLRTLG